MHESPRLTSTDPIDLEIVYGADRIDVTSPAQEQFRHTAYLASAKIGSVEKMVEAYLAVGPGLHNVEEHDILNFRERSIQAALKHLPREVVRHGKMEETGSEQRSSFVYFGNLAIRGRMADSAEIEASRADAKAYHEAVEQRRREAIIAKDAEKIDYTGYDHVHIAVGDKEFFLNFDFPQAHLAFRGLLLVHNTPPGDYLHWEVFDKALWSQMPTTERALLGIKEADVFATGPRPIKDMTLGLIQDVARPLGLVERSEFKRTSTAFDLQLHSIPNPDNYDGKAVPIVPPDTPRGVLEVLRNQAQMPASEALESHTSKLVELIQRPGWAHEDAIEILDIIMSPEGKIALLQLHTKANRSREEQAAQAEEMLQSLHTRVFRTLGYDAYYGARRNRTIAGNHATGTNKIRHTGGRVEGGKTKEDRLKRWAIGRPTTLKSRGV
jgi:hypothetical protein